MKNLVEYIIEALEKLNLLKPKASYAQEAFGLMDAIQSYLKSLTEEYSLTNQQDAIKLFNGLKKSRNIASLISKNKTILSSYDIDNPKKFASFLYNNAPELLKEGGKWDWGKTIKNIKQFNPSKLETEYKDWLKSDNKVDGHKWDEEDYDPNTVERTIVIYDRKDGRNPDTTIEYPFKGMRGKETDHQLNMIRVDWCYKCGFKPSEKYFDAYSKLADHYYKDGPAKYEDPFEFDDI